MKQRNELNVKLSLIAVAAKTVILKITKTLGVSTNGLRYGNAMIP
ncbi:hypothetical protein LBR02_01650 [Levilactobacillus brevis]|nr:hypothetical protein LBR02_01650 [Levilactobacillus brevis]